MAIKKQRKWNHKAQEATQEEGSESDTMSFEEIGEAMGLSTLEVKKIFNQAMRKLKVPNDQNKVFWEYANISDNDTTSDMSGRTL